MAIFHLSAKIISRGKGQSAIAAAAYRSGEHLFDQQASEPKAYRTRSDRIAFTDIMAPTNAPEWVHDRNTLWNTAERVEKRKDAQLAREFEIGLPHELTAQQREWLVRDFAREAFVRKGYVVDIAIHAPEAGSDKRNHHAHLMVTRRTVGPEGFSAKKDWQYDPKQLEGWREQWEHLANRHLERHGHNARIDRRSLKEQGIDREPTIHIGYAANEMTERGVPSDRMAALNEILARNELRFDLETIEIQLVGLEKQLADEQQLVAQAQRKVADNGQHHALAAAWSSRRRHDAATQISRAQHSAPTPAPPQKAKQTKQPVASPVRAPEPKPQRVRPVAAMEQTPTDDKKPQQAPQVPQPSGPPPRPEAQPAVQQAKPVEWPQPSPETSQPSQDRPGWRYDENWGWEKIEDAASRVGRSQTPAPPREAQAPATKEPEKTPEPTKAAKPQTFGYGTNYVRTPQGDVPVVPTEHILASQRAAELAAAKALEDQQRQKDLAELARAARADQAKQHAPSAGQKATFEAKVAGAIREDAQKMRAQVREERQEDAHAKWQTWAQGQNPDTIKSREIAGRTVQAGWQGVRSGYRVVNRATGVVSSLSDFLGNLLSSSGPPPEQPNRINMRTLTSDPAARAQYQLAQHAEAQRRGMAVEALDNIQRDVAAGRDLKAEDVSKLPHEALMQIASKGDAYVNQMIESSRKRASEYWQGRGIDGD